MFERIETEDDYRNALNRFLEICDAPEYSKEKDELNVLMFLMEKYERENCSTN
jgi:antitoxin component HigA of HigAB toxin-antitoxin module